MAGLLTLPIADSQSGRLTAAVVGLMIGGLICLIVVRRTMKPGSSTPTGEPITEENRKVADQTVAAIYAGLSIVCLVVMIIVGTTVPLLLAAGNCMFGLLVLRKTGLPRDHPVVRRLAAISRR